VKPTVIVLTDGEATDRNDLPRAARLLGKVAKVITVGIGSDINPKELALIAGSKHNVILTPSYKALHSKVQDVITGSCGKQHLLKIPNLFCSGIWRTVQSNLVLTLSRFTCLIFKYV
jgi:hypothetical protein